MVVGSLTIKSDVVVVGAGPGGYVAALRAAQLGKDVALIDKEKALGGVCLQHGCIPTKALIHASNIFQEIKDSKDMGIHVDNLSLDFKKMMSWKDSILKKLDSGIRNLCKQAGVEVFNGVAKFEGDNEVHLSGQSDVNVIKYKKAIVATGSSTIEIPGFEFNNNNILSSREALQLEKVPKKIVIIGGGYIGTEMATIFGKLGSEMHIVEMTGQLIPVMEKEVVEVVADKLKDFNIYTHLNSKASGYQEKDGKIFVKIEENEAEKELEADKVLVCVGRKPNTKNIGLENVGVELDDKSFIKTDNSMRTNNEDIYAIGDVVGQPMLAHKASRQAKVAAEAIAGQKSAFDNKVIPAVVFNDPEVASAGLTEQEAKDKNYDIKTSKFPFSALGKALAINKTAGFVKMVVNAKDNTLLGIQAVGPNVSNIVSEAALAIEMGANAEDIALTIHPHPTISESVMEAADSILGKGVHYNG